MLLSQWSLGKILQIHWQDKQTNVSGLSLANVVSVKGLFILSQLQMAEDIVHLPNARRETNTLPSNFRTDTKELTEDLLMALRPL